MIVAMLERSNGNAETGTAWIETATFIPDQPIRDVIAWAARQTKDKKAPTRHGRLMLDVVDIEEA